MSAHLEGLKDAPRLLMQVPLQPLQGSRFQPTGFPDLGAAVYQTNQGDELLVESAQSMANRLEEVCWDGVARKVVEPLEGISYINVEQDGEFLTTSLLEAHRINSPYILESKDKGFFELLQAETEAMEKKPIDFQLLARILMKYDCNCLLHVVFLAKKQLAGGRLRVPRSLSAFIEATGVRVATSGGVKRDDVDPTGGRKEDEDDTEEGSKKGSEKGFGHVPYSRDEYTAENITAYFSLDLSQIGAFGLGEGAEDLLITMALYKIRRFLAEGLRLRTACDLEPADDLVIKRPEGWQFPQLTDLKEVLPGLVKQVAAKGLFADPPVTTVAYVP